MAETTASFPDTDWSALRHLSADDDPGRQRLSFAELLHSYIPAIRRYLNKRYGSVGAEQIGEWLQGFVASRLFEGNLFRRAERNRGKLRALLVSSVDHYVLDELRRTHSDKQRTRAASEIISRGDNGDPARLFDRSWAENVVAEALERTRLRCESTDRAAAYQLLHRRMVEGDQGKPRHYRLLAEEFGFATPVQASTALHTAQRIFRRKLYDVLLEYDRFTSTAEQVRELKQILSNLSAK